MNHSFIKRLRERHPRVTTDPLYRDIVTQHGEGTLMALTEMVTQGVIERNEGARLWADGYQVAYVNPLENAVNRDLLRLIPSDQARQHQCLPISEFDGVITLVMANFDNTSLPEDLERKLGRPISPVFALPDEIEAAISLHYTGFHALSELTRKLDSEIWRASYGSRDAASIALQLESQINQWMNMAAKFLLSCDASAYTLSKRGTLGQLSMRLGKNRYPVVQFNETLHRVLACHFDRIALQKASISDSAIRAILETEPADFELNRWQSGGEIAVSLTLRRRRLLSPGQAYRQRRRSTHYSMFLQDRLATLLRQPDGLILFGTKDFHEVNRALNCLVDHVDANDRSVSFVGEMATEVPPTIQHFPLERATPAAFQRALDAALKQQPDLLIAGPVIDAKSFTLLLDAVMQGVLVVPLVQANNAHAAIARAIHYCGKPDVLVHQLQAALAQAAVPHLNLDSRKRYNPSRFELERLFTDIETSLEPAFYRPPSLAGKPWEHFQGELMLQELLLIDPVVRHRLAQGPQSQAYWSPLPLDRHRTLRYDGLVKAALGLTTLADIERATTAE